MSEMPKYRKNLWNNLCGIHWAHITFTSAKPLFIYYLPAHSRIYSSQPKITVGTVFIKSTWSKSFISLVRWWYRIILIFKIALSAWARFLTWLYGMKVDFFFATFFLPCVLKAFWRILLLNLLKIHGTIVGITRTFLALPL